MALSVAYHVWEAATDITLLTTIVWPALLGSNKILCLLATLCSLSDTNSLQMAI